jgi:hypothetical protein
MKKSNLKSQKSKTQIKNQIRYLPLEEDAGLTHIHLLSFRCGFEI